MCPDASLDAGKVKMSRNYYNKLDESMEARAVVVEERVQAFNYGKDQVEVSYIENIFVIGIYVV